VSGSGNIARLLDAPARRFGDEPAIVVGERVVRTWAGLAGGVAARAGGLQQGLGLSPGDRVAIASHNRADYLEWLFAIWHAGCVAVPISDRLHPREISDLCDDGHASVCLAGPELADPLESLMPAYTTLVPLGGERAEAMSTFEPIDPVAREAIDDAWIFFTSGTTGRSKGAQLSHANLLAMTAAYLIDVDNVGVGDSLLHVAALSHASGLFALSFLGRGARQVLTESGGFDSDELLHLVATNERSTFFVPPTLLRRLAASAAVRPGHRHRIGRILVGAAPVLPSDLIDAVGAFGPTIWHGYGQGESPCTITAMSAADVAANITRPERLATVGTARFATRVRVVDEDDHPLPAGKIGEVVVDGPTVMHGYLGLPDQTREVLRNGWLHTGDLGRFDNDGFLTLVDRAKDVIISGGANIYPREVEDVIALDPAVAEVAVVGVPNAEWGESAIAVIVAAHGAIVDCDRLDARCLESIARHKRPRRYEIVDELPRNAYGKILKRELCRRFSDDPSAPPPH
jgi:long-chain acyl-CoA synthetase